MNIFSIRDVNLVTAKAIIITRINRDICEFGSEHLVNDPVIIQKYLDHHDFEYLEDLHAFKIDNNSLSSETVSINVIIPHNLFNKTISLHDDQVKKLVGCPTRLNDGKFYLIRKIDVGYALDKVIFIVGCVACIKKNCYIFDRHDTDPSLITSNGEWSFLEQVFECLKK